MERTLIGKGLTPKETMQALSLARAKQEVGMLYPPKRELCYQILTEEDRKLLDRLIATLKHVFDKKKSEYIKKDEMKPLLLQENLMPDEAEQAISLAEANDVIERCFAYVDEIDGESAYKLLTQEELEAREKEELQDLEEDTQIRKKRERTKQTEKKKRGPVNSPLRDRDNH
jgi:hypothetical protein